MSDDTEIQVLHVDDESDFTDMVGTFLEREDDRITVATATSASEGLDRLKKNDIDCVVSDHEMPAMTGIELLETVREKDDDLPFILFTGKGSEDVASDAISAGVTDYLQKQSGTERYELLANRITNVVSQIRDHELAAETEQRLQELAETTNDILWMFTADWSDCLFINSAYEDLWGRSVDTLAKHPTDFLNGVHPDDQVQIQEAMDRLTKGQSVDFEIRVNPDEDYQRWVWIQGSPITDEDGSVDRVAGFVRDITDQKERESELRAEWEFIEQALDALNDVFYVIGTDGNLRRWNSRLREVTGYPDEEIAGIQATEFFPEDEQEKITHAIEETLRTGQSIVEADFLTKDGERIPYEFTGSQLANAEEDLIGLIGIGRDISERQQRERELERQNERLEKFTSVVSHDLRNPLNVAQGRVQLAREECESDHLDDAATAVDRSLALIDDLLTLAREGEEVREFDTIALAETIEGCWQNVETKGATLVAKSDRTIRADASRLKQLLENLIRNAVEHGGDDVTITIGDLDDGFYVADDGPGIPDDKRDQVFERGYSTADKGTGFGLNIVKEIVEAHGWQIRVTDSTDGGARFEISGIEVAE